MQNTISNIISLSIFILIIIPLFFFIKTSDNYYLFSIISSSIVAFSTSIIKYIVIYIFPTYKILYRPNKNAKCSLLNIYDGSYKGFPSGHMATTTYLIFIIREYLFENEITSLL